MASPRFFPTAAKFRAWLDKKHGREEELWPAPLIEASAGQKRLV